MISILSINKTFLKLFFSQFFRLKTFFLVFYDYFSFKLVLVESFTNAFTLFFHISIKGINKWKFFQTIYQFLCLNNSFKVNNYH